MSVDPADSRSHQIMLLDKGQHFVVLRERSHLQCLKQSKRDASRFQRAARELADHERMAKYFVAVQ